MVNPAASVDEQLPAWVSWQHRLFPDAKLLLLRGHEPALVDSGFVGHAQQTAEWVRAHRTSDGGRQHALALRPRRRQRAATGHRRRHRSQRRRRRRRGPARPRLLPSRISRPARRPLHRRPAAVRRATLRLGDADCQVIRTPGHTSGHLSLWQPGERLLVVGDALSDYDVGWVNLALDGPDAAATALASLHRLANLNPRVLPPAHGPIPADPGAAFDTALRRAQRLVDDPAGAVWYAARRIFAFALMIRDRIPVDEIEPYLHARAWLTDAARLLARTPDALAAELVDTMLRSGTIVFRDLRLHATGEHTPVAAETLRVPFPRDWSATAPTRSEAVESHGHLLRTRDLR